MASADLKTEVQSSKIKERLSRFLLPLFTIRKLIIILLIGNIFINSISNYESYSFIVKALFALFMLAAVYIDKKKRTPLLTGSRNKSDKRYTAAVIIFLFLILITSFYSPNPRFGLEKFLSIIISSVPILYTSYYLFKNLSKSDLSAAFVFIIATGLAISLFALIISPFDVSTVYKISLSRWSHVVFGRYSGLIFLIILAVSFKLKTPRKFYLLPLLILFGYSIYFSGFRAGLTGIIIFGLIMLVYVFAVKINSTQNLIFALSLALGIFLSIEIPGDLDPVKQERYEVLKSGDYEKFESDPSLKARIDSFNRVIELINESPVLGTGIGGFRSTDTNDFTHWIKYPHNIILESAAEFGIIGLLILIYFLILSVKYLFKLSLFVLIIFLFAFWLSLFSKDLASNVLLFLPIAWMMLRGEDRERICREL